MGIVPFMFGFAPTFLAPAFNKEVIDGGPDTLGYLMTAFGVGSLIGALTLAPLVATSAARARCCSRQPTSGPSASQRSRCRQALVAAMIFGIFIGVFSSLVGSLNMSVVTLAIKPEIRGRVMAIMMMTHGIMPIGMFPVAAAAEFIGIDVALLLSAVLLAVLDGRDRVVVPGAQEDQQGGTGGEA